MHSFTEDRGVTISAEYTGEGMGDLVGGIKTGATYEGLLRLGLTLDLEKLVCWKGATFYASSLYPHGEGISQDHSGDFNIASNITAYNSFRLDELWLDQKFLPDKTLSIRLGQLASDVAFLLSATSALFVNAAFGTVPTISFNNNLPIYPFGGLGIRVAYTPASGWFVRAGVFDGDPGDPSTVNKYGVAFHLNLSGGVIVLAEAGYAINSSADSKGLAGYYKIGAWYDSCPEETPQIRSQHNSDAGFCAIVDQMIYRKSDIAPGSLTAFFRISAAPDQNINLVPFYVDGGFNLDGPFPCRDKDIFGMALGYTLLSDHFTPVNTPIRSGHETVFETSYKIQINDHLFLQPDIQYILNPGGYSHLNNALVAVVRFDFTY
ncbi:MAG TPA: carbohydrate porin [Chthoniobacterales bacterium]|nr:carbohydrate porin [Chthoniobacterales bacterium]